MRRGAAVAAGTELGRAGARAAGATPKSLADRRLREGALATTALERWFLGALAGIAAMAADWGAARFTRDFPLLRTFAKVFAVLRAWGAEDVSSNAALEEATARAGATRFFDESSFETRWVREARADAGSEWMGAFRLGDESASALRCSGRSASTRSRLVGAVLGLTGLDNAAISIFGLRAFGLGLGLGFSSFAILTGGGFGLSITGIGAGFGLGFGMGFGMSGVFATTGSGFTGTGTGTGGLSSTIGAGAGSLQTMSWVWERSTRSRNAVKRTIAIIIPPNITAVLAPPSSSGPTVRHPSSSVISWAGSR
jgi:hypothetical protein